MRHNLDIASDDLFIFPGDPSVEVVPQEQVFGVEQIVMVGPAVVRGEQRSAEADGERWDPVLPVETRRERC